MQSSRVDCMSDQRRSWFVKTSRDSRPYPSELSILARGKLSIQATSRKRKKSRNVIADSWPIQATSRPRCKNTDYILNAWKWAARSNQFFLHFESLILSVHPQYQSTSRSLWRIFENVQCSCFYSWCGTQFAASAANRLTLDATFLQVASHTAYGRNIQQCVRTAVKGTKIKVMRKSSTRSKMEFRLMMHGILRNQSAIVLLIVKH
jgi:hypothetical protein